MSCLESWKKSAKGTPYFFSGRNYLRDSDLYSCRFKLMHVSCSWYFPPQLSSKEIDFLEVNPLKYCPRCNFTFADFHHVCDFDGAELISAPEQPSHGPRPSLLRR